MDEVIKFKSLEELERLIKQVIDLEDDVTPYISFFKKAIELKSDKDLIYLKLAVYFFNKGDYPNSLEILKKYSFNEKSYLAYTTIVYFKHLLD